MLRALHVFTSLVVLLGCDTSTLDRAWTIRFMDPGDRAAARAVEVRIHRGACDGPILYEASIRADSPMTMAPPVFDDEALAFEAWALGVDCARIAYVCEPVGRPREDGELVLVLDSELAGSPTCEAPEVCDDGVCTECPGASCGDPRVPRVVFPWNGVATGSHTAPTDMPEIIDHPLLPEIAWARVPSAQSYRVQMEPCAGPETSGCTFEGTVDEPVDPTGEALQTWRPTEFLAPGRWIVRVSACDDMGCAADSIRYFDVGRMTQDLDGDGDGDLIYAAEDADGTIYVHQLSMFVDTGFVDDARTSLAYDQIHELAWIGDYDGDGIGEAAMIVEDAGERALVVLRQLDSWARETVRGLDDATLGRAGDVDGDGYADLAVALRSEGVVRVYLGGPSFDASRTVEILAEPGQLEFGMRLAPAGDRDGDGLADLALVFRRALDEIVIQVWSLAGRSPALIESRDAGTGQLSPMDEHPVSLAGGHDFDGDRQPDLVLGRPLLSDILIYGVGDTPYLYEDGNEGLGTDVALGDLDGSGRARAVAAEPRYDIGIGGALGAWQHVRLTSTGLSALRVPIISPGGMFGAAVAVVDVDGEGRDDVATISEAGNMIHLGIFSSGTIGVTANFLVAAENDSVRFGPLVH